MRRFDEENSATPIRSEPMESIAPRTDIRAVVTDWVLSFVPEASEELRLPRFPAFVSFGWCSRSYPMTRVGYLQCVKDSKKFHAQRAGEILRRWVYPAENHLERHKNIPYPLRGG